MNLLRFNYHLKNNEIATVNLRNQEMARGIIVVGIGTGVDSGSIACLWQS